jgi:hypothetical protein
MHNGSYNNYHASSNYHHVSPRQASQHRSSRFPENAPNRGNFVRGRDPVNNWSRVHDNQPRVLEEQTLFRRSERVQWGANAMNRGGKFQRASQSPEKPHQIGWDEAAESEVDEWGREIRERRQSPTYDERPSERIREEAPNHEIYAYAGSPFLPSVSSNVQLREEAIQRPRSAKDLGHLKTSLLSNRRISRELGDDRSIKHLQKGHGLQNE